MFLESPWLLAGVLVPVQMILLVVWSRRRTTGTVRAVWCGFAAAALLFVVQSVVVTPRESVIEFCRELAGDAERGDLMAIRTRFGSDFSGEGFGRRWGDQGDFTAWYERRLQQVDIRGASVRDFEFEFDGPGSCRAEFVGSAFVSDANAFSGRVSARVRLDLTKEDDGWRIGRMEMRSSPTVGIGSLRDIIR